MLWYRESHVLDTSLQTNKQRQLNNAVPRDTATQKKPQLPQKINHNSPEHDTWHEYHDITIMTRTYIANEKGAVQNTLTIQRYSFWSNWLMMALVKIMMGNRDQVNTNHSIPKGTPVHVVLHSVTTRLTLFTFKVPLWMWRLTSLDG